jgi:hypothetical protein
MTIYEWVISSMNTKPQEGNLMDVVVCVNWVRNAQEESNNKIYYSSTSGSFYCDTPSETDFTAYPDLTYAQVCGWLETGMNVEEIDAYLASQLDIQINPPTIILPNPWETTPVSQMPIIN